MHFFDASLGTRVGLAVPIDCFGPERCMFENNFTVDKRSVSYPALWNALKKIAADFSEDEKQALFYGTAARVYSL